MERSDRSRGPGGGATGEAPGGAGAAWGEAPGGAGAAWGEAGGMITEAVNNHSCSDIRARNRTRLANV